MYLWGVDMSIKESKQGVSVRAKSTIKIKSINGGNIDLSIKGGNDLVDGINSALSFAGIKKKVVLVDLD
jgi:hypothetical protein